MQLDSIKELQFILVELVSNDNNNSKFDFDLTLIDIYLKSMSQNQLAKALF